MFNLLKTIYKNPVAKISLNDKRLNPTHSNIRKKFRMPAVATFNQYCAVFPGSEIMLKEGRKEAAREEIKLSR